MAAKTTTMEGALSFSVADVVKDVLQQHGNRHSGLHLDIDKVHPGAVPKVVESPCDSTLVPDGAALSAFQYFENVRNFLVVVQETRIPTFEASDMEQGGKSARVVNCILALKSHREWKQTGGNGVWKFGGSVKPTVSAKSFVRKNSKPFTNSLSRNFSMGEKSLNALSSNIESNKMPTNCSLSMLVHAILLDKKPEEVPMVRINFLEVLDLVLVQSLKLIVVL
ncbi:hypothetical protein F2P56_015802, partial [Juglans regia]